jgi:hypothetical protein
MDGVLGLARTREGFCVRQDEETHESLSSLHRVLDPGRGATGIVDRLGLVAHA